jgi:hypothetical protein
VPTRRQTPPVLPCSQSALTIVRKKREEKEEEEEEEERKKVRKMY